MKSSSRQHPLTTQAIASTATVSCNEKMSTAVSHADAATQARKHMNDSQNSAASSATSSSTFCNISVLQGKDEKQHHYHQQVPLRS
jgi:hypothetical protein